MEPEEPQAARDRAGAGKAGGNEQGQGRAVADPAWGGARQREDQADQGGAEGLPHQPCGGKNATGAAGAIRRSARQDRAIDALCV